jgi:hypothetical protein
MSSRIERSMACRLYVCAGDRAERAADDVVLRAGVAADGDVARTRIHVALDDLEPDVEGVAGGLGDLRLDA